MKIFIAGASGFLGSAVTKELAKGITSWSGRPMNIKSLKQKGVNYIKGDLLESGEWCDRIREVDKVISLISPIDSSEKFPRTRLKHIQESIPKRWQISSKRPPTAMQIR